MAEAFSWKWPYCNHDAIIQSTLRESQGFYAGVHGVLMLSYEVIFLPKL